MKEKSSKKLIIVIIIFFSYYIGNYYYKGYLAKNELNKSHIANIIKQYEPKRYELLLDAKIRLKRREIETSYYKDYSLSLLTPILSKSRNEMYLMASDDLIYEYFKLLNKTALQLNTEDCYKYFHSQTSNKSQFLTEILKDEYELISSKILKSFYDNQQHSILNKETFTKNMKLYIPEILKISGIKTNIFEKEEPSISEKEKMCKFTKTLYTSLIQDKQIKLLRYTLIEM